MKNLFAARTALMARSSVREFLKHAARPGVISFAGGLPAPELFPLEAFAAATERVFTGHGNAALQYGLTEGLTALREYLAGRFNAALENVLITSGAQQALDILGRVLLDPSDTVLVENPTYLNLLSAWRPLGVSFSAAPAVDLKSGAEKLFYCMPNFRNPTGTSLDLATRERLASSARLIIEDDAYGELRYEGKAHPTLYQLSGGRTIYVGTFSKVLAPALRIGWIVGPAPLVEFCTRCKQATDLQTSPFNQFVAQELIEAGVIQTQIPLLRREYKIRRDAMLQALEANMPREVTWSHPEGGMFLLLTLPAGMNAREVSRRALENDVLVVPGDDFHVTGGENTMRLNFSNARPEQIREGIRRLGEIISSRLEQTSSQEAIC